VEQRHRDAIDRWAEAAAVDDEALAVVVAGSLTKGYGLTDSDVDGFVIVSDDAPVGPPSSCWTASGTGSTVSRP
jgi:predicted nucleotidyltransferase